MSTLEINKIAGSILLVLMVIQVVGILGDALVRPREATTTMQINAAPAQIAAEKPKPVEPVLPLLAKADIKKGEDIHKKCLACHDFAKGGPNKIGPDLYGVVGRPIASHPGFDYSSALKDFAKKHGKWTYELLNHFIHDPRQDVPGTKMTFAGLDKVQERADVIAFLRTLNDNPPPLPTPEEIKAVEPKTAPPTPQAGQPSPAPAKGPAAKAAEQKGAAAPKTPSGSPAGVNAAGGKAAPATTPSAKGPAGKAPAAATVKPTGGAPPEGQGQK